MKSPGAMGGGGGSGRKVHNESSDQSSKDTSRGMILPRPPFLRRCLPLIPFPSSFHCILDIKLMATVS